MSGSSDTGGTAPRVALVTGGARGIGAGITDRLLRDGWIVYALDKEFPPSTNETGAPGRLRKVTGDVGNEAAVAEALERVEREAGRLHGLVSNAGIMVRKPLTELSLGEWNQVLAVNLTATFLLARTAAPLLRQTRGAIVTISSTRAHMSEPDTESYAAAKGGLVALTHALAISLGPEVRANCISPGWIDTHDETLRERDHTQHPAGRVGRVEDVASLAAWLLGPESGFCTGAEFTTDGGMTRRMIYEE